MILWKRLWLNTASMRCSALCPARFAKEGALEVINSGIPFLVLTAEGIPEQDILEVVHFAELKGAKVSRTRYTRIDFSREVQTRGQALMLCSEKDPWGSYRGAVPFLTRREECSRANGIGQSTVVGIGGGPIWGLSQQAVLKMFEDDPETKAVVLLGEVGGRMEHEAADFIGKSMAKPVIVLIVGRMAPKGSQMGHAGAIIEGDEGTAESKTAALEKAGALVARSSLEIPDIIKKIGV